MKMGELTISTGQFSIAYVIITRGYVGFYWDIRKNKNALNNQTVLRIYADINVGWMWELTQQTIGIV